jgi:hypothetical protein
MVAVIAIEMNPKYGKGGIHAAQLLDKFVK